MKPESTEYLKQMDLYIQQLENGVKSCETVIDMTARQIKLSEERIHLERLQMESSLSSICIAKEQVARFIAQEETEG